MRVTFNRRQAIRVLKEASVDEGEAKKIAAAICAQDDITEQQIAALIRNFGNSPEFSVNTARQFFIKMDPAKQTQAFEASFISDSQRPKQREGWSWKLLALFFGLCILAGVLLVMYSERLGPAIVKGFSAIGSIGSTSGGADGGAVDLITVPTPDATPPPSAPKPAKNCGEDCANQSEDLVMQCLVGCLGSLETENSKLRNQLQKLSAQNSTLQEERAAARTQLAAKETELADLRTKLAAKEVEITSTIQAKEAETTRQVAAKAAELTKKAEAEKQQAAEAAAAAAKQQAAAEAKAKIPSCAASIQACKTSPISQAMKAQGRPDAWIAEQCERVAKFKRAAKQCQ